MPGQGSASIWASLVRNVERRNLATRRSATIPVYPSTPNAPNVQYCGTTKWTAVAIWAATTSYSVGNLVRQTAGLGTLTVGNERVFVCTVAGTSLGSEPTWNLNYGSSTQEDSSGATPVWQECTGRSQYGWSAPHARLATALSVPWCSPGDIVYVSNHHAETQSTTMTIAVPGTAAFPNKVICVNDAGSVPPVAADVTTGASVTSTGNGSPGLSVTGGACYFYGLAIMGNGNGSAAGVSCSLLYARFENCVLALGAGSNVTSFIYLASQRTDLVSTQVQFTGIGQSVTANLNGCNVFWINTANAVLGTVPTTLFVFNNSYLSFTLVGVDLSAMGSGKSIANAAPASTVFYGACVLQDCKLGSSVSVTTGVVPAQGSFSMTLVNCDSANTNYRYFKQTYQGTIQQDTSVVRTGGATDNTTPVSRKMVSSANSTYFSPFESDPVTYWNESLGSIALTIPIVVETAGGQAPATGLTNADVWIEVEYLGTSGFPLGAFDYDSKSGNILSVPAAQPLDVTSVWAPVLSAPVQQSLTSTFTPTGKGPIRVKVMLARPNTTLWFDPKAVTSTGRTWMLPGGQVNEGDDPATTAVQTGVVYNQGDSTGSFSGGGGGGVFFGSSALDGGLS